MKRLKPILAAVCTLAFLLTAVAAFAVGAPLGILREVAVVPGTSNVGVTQTIDASTGFQTWTVFVDAGAAGGVTSVSGSSSVNVSPTTGAAVVSLPASGVSGSSCTNCSLSYNSDGIITAASNGSSGAVSSVTGTAPIVVSPATGAVNVSLTTPLSTPNGGTGVIAPGAHFVAVAEGSSPFNFVSPSTAGLVLSSNGTGSDPSFQGVSELQGNPLPSSPSIGFFIWNGLGFGWSGCSGDLSCSFGSPVVFTMVAPRTAAQVTESTSSGSTTPLGSGGVIASLSSTVTSNQKIAVDASVECASTLAVPNDIDYGINVDGSTFALGHRFDNATTNIFSTGSTHWLTPTLSAGSHTINLTATQSQTNSATCGWSLRTMVLTN